MKISIPSPLLLLTPFILLSGTALMAQMVIRGNVRDSATRKAVENVQVTTAGNQALNPYTTDQDGYFRLTLRDNISAGMTIRLRIEASGYRVWNQDIVVSDKPIEDIYLAKASGKQAAVNKRTSQPKASVHLHPDSSGEEPVSNQTFLLKELDGTSYIDGTTEQAVKSEDKIVFSGMHKGNIIGFFGKSGMFSISGKMRLSGNSLEVIDGNVSGQLSLYEDRAKIRGSLTIKSSEITHEIDLLRQQ